MTAATTHRCTEKECPFVGQVTSKSCRCHKTAEQMLVERVAELEAALKFYAEPRRYDGPNQNNPGNDPHTKSDALYFTDVTRDGGGRASAALSKAGV